MVLSESSYMSLCGFHQFQLQLSGVEKSVKRLIHFNLDVAISAISLYIYVKVNIY